MKTAAFLPLLAALLAAIAGPALASPVELRSDVALHDGRVTLGDIFSGAGRAAPLVVANAAGAAVVLDAGRVQAMARANGLDWDNARGLTRIIARADVAPAEAAATSERSRSVLAYGRDISTGEVIQAEDLVWSRSAVAPSDAPRDSSMVVGQAARRPLRSGAAVSSHDVAAPQVVKKDDVVSVAYEEEGIRLVMQGKALSGAAVGEMFDVINPVSKKQIQVVAVGPGAAAVGPAADRLKASVRANPQFIASLR